MEMLSITLTNDPALVNRWMTDIKNYSQQSQIRVRITWTVVPAGRTIEAASLFFKADEEDVDNVSQVDISISTDVDTVGEITNTGSSGAAVMDFIVDATVFNARQAYFNYLQMIDDTGYTRTWTGQTRFLEEA